jgi:hypothetical protein
MDWEGHAEREERRYAEGAGRLSDEGDARQKQLLRLGAAATGAGLARLMQGRRGEAAGWFARSAERFRESFGRAPAGSWGRLLGAVKARVLAGDWAGAERDARWALDQDPASSGSPIGRYAAALSLLVLGLDSEACGHARSLRDEHGAEFPGPVAATLVALAERDAASYERDVAAVLASFEKRDAYLEGIPVADTVLVLEALAARRGIAALLRSSLLPEAG